MRILHILDHSIPLHSGYTFRTRSILENQRALGWQTYHVTSPKHMASSGFSEDEEDVEGLHFFRTQASQGAISKIPVLSQLEIIRLLECRIEEVINIVKPDILHAHSPSLNGEAALRAGKKHGIPVVYEVRAFWEDAAVDHGTSAEWGMRYRFSRAFETSVIKRADAVTTICEGLRNEIILRGIAGDKITVIPNSVDITQFSADIIENKALKDDLGLNDKVVIGFVGSFYAYEGLKLLLKSVPIIAKKIPNLIVLLVGGGPEYASLRKLSNDLNVSDHVTFTGRVPHDAVQSYYSLIEILIYPRLSMRLTDLVTPLKPLEAMAQRRLVLASDVGGHRELIRDNVNGILFSAGNDCELAHRVIYLFENKDKWAAIRDEGRKFVEEERNWENSVKRYTHVYKRIMNSYRT